MGQPDSRFARQMSGERSVGHFIPYTNHVSPTTIVTQDGDYLRIWRVDGITHETADAEQIIRRKEELNTIFRSIASPAVSVWTHTVRRRVADKLDSKYSNEFCEELDRKYYEGFTGFRMMANELYFTLVYRPRPSRMEKMAVKAAKRSIEEIKSDQLDAIHKLDQLAFELEAGLRRYGLTPLTTYEDQRGAMCSQALEFLNFLLTGEWQKVRVPKGPLNDYLGNAYVFVGLETIEIRLPTSTRFAQLIDFKDYPEWTEPGLLNDLMYESCEYVMTHSYAFMGKKEGLSYLKKQANQLHAAEDGSATQIYQIGEAIDELTQGRFAMGEYHFSLMVFAESMQKLNQRSASVLTKLKEQGFIAVKVATATDAAFYAQLPANWKYRPRIAGITSQNFAGLASLHNFAAGKRDGNPWGQALTLLKTPSMQPFYFNFHSSKDDEDSTDKKVLGNTRVIGASGTGKTVLLNMLLAQATKYQVNSPTGFSAVFYDKDRGAELAIRAMGGKYLALKNGRPTGFNPFQMQATDRNLLFLESWVGKLLADGEKLTAVDKERISAAVRTTMTMPKPYRRLSALQQNITEGLTQAERENSLKRRLDRWLQGRPLGWVFDNPTDELDFNARPIIGIDGTDFLDNEAVNAPIASYLLYRQDEIIDGRRFMYFMDEAWKWVDDDSEDFADFAGNKQLTIRKQNGLGVFATQMPSSMLRSKIGASLVQQVATEVYLPNPRADRDEYTKGFKLTDAEFELVAALKEDSRMFMVKQGHRSALAMLDLGGLDDELAILSGSSDNIELMDELLDELGEDPAAWVPEFHRRRKARVKAVRNYQ